MIPGWLHVLAEAALVFGLICSLVVGIDVARHRQQMWIMDVVWPVTAVFGTVLTLWLYFRYGRLATREQMQAAKQHNEKPPSKSTPFPAIVAKDASHCGAGCCLGDICAEWLAFGFPAVAVWLGVTQGIWQAIKADTLSLSAWQIGIYGFMAIAYFWLFRHVWGAELKVNSPEFWFMMQIAMLCGWATSYPVNWWSIRSGVKEKM